MIVCRPSITISAIFKTIKMTMQGIHHVNKHVVYRWKFATVSECHRKKDIVDIAEKSICAIGHQ